MAAVVDPASAVAHLSRADPVMAGLIEQYGTLAREPGERDVFRAIARAVVFQQLSGRAAGTIHGRFCALFPGAVPDPALMLTFADDDIRGVGLSRQKVASLRDLAAHAASGEPTTEHVDAWDDEEVIAHLTRVRGVGRWTAEMYLMFSLQRPDVLPVNDLGLNKAMAQLYELPSLPRPDDVRRIGAPWRPHATAACWYLWRSLDPAP